MNIEYSCNAQDRSRFMIDVETYKKMHQAEKMYEREAYRIIACGRDEDDDIRTEPQEFKEKEISFDQEGLETRDEMILPSYIHGFDFMEREWVKIRVDLVEDVQWNKKSFDRLVLPSGTKTMIQALVTARLSEMQDIVAHKGNGLVILLHGGPGTGKTLTAETVAEISERPLYRVTCGNLGTSAKDVEEYLTSILYLGKRWGCVLLLDEADIFLEERSLADLERNSLVSIFLRSLDYYDGILILTSNRVGTFDAAFTSRIQVSLHYPALSRSSRKRIWEIFVEILEEIDLTVDIAELQRHLDDLSEDEMNGRQIRNCITTARSLAAFKRERLGYHHLQEAIRAAYDFQRYLKDVHSGLTEDEMAREDNLR